MSAIGQQIKKFRTEKGLTQEQLGELVGVTTQAVSKWERGGVPDAELLPSLSRALGVSIDALFGQEERSAPFALAKKLSCMNREDAFRYAFNLCWAMMLGLHPATKDTPDDYLLTFFSSIQQQENIPPFSTIYFDQGLLTSRTNLHFNHFFFMLEPDGGLRSQLTDLDAIRRLFAALSDPDTLKILLYLYTRLNTPLASSLISQNTGLSLQEVDRHMAVLCQVGCASRKAIATAEGEIYSYMFVQESAVVALLCLADQIRLNDEHNIVWDVNRTKAIMHSTDS